VDPVALCQEITVQLDANGQAAIKGADVDGGSTDNCGVASLDVVPSSFTCADLGANIVTLTVTDTSGNTDTCAATVTVEDSIDPAALCQDITAQLDANGQVTITGADVDAGSTDNCCIASLDVVPSSFTCAELGPNAVTLTVTDASGNTDTCAATVTVEDNVDPVALCQDITVQLDGNGQAAITAADVDGGSTDNCGIASLEALPNSFTCAEIGANAVTLIVTDTSGNTDTCEAIVTVEDGVDPMAVCQSITVQLDANGQAAITGADVDGGSTDNCGIASLDVSPNVFTCADLGLNAALLTVTDTSGNTDVCVASVTVQVGGQLTLTSPNGGEEWYPGATVDITWSSQGAVGPNVKLRLCDGGDCSRWIRGSTPNDGEFTWTVPCDVPAGCDYTVKVYSASVLCIDDFSDASFCVLNPACVGSPNGGEEWIQGSRQTITWDPACFGAPQDLVKVKLFRGCGFADWIKTSTPNDGELDWTVPCGLEPGDDYRVRIYAVSDFSLSDYSDDAFTVVAPACVTSPNGGEAWIRGSGQVITWDPACFGVPQDAVKLKLFRDCSFLAWITGSTDNDGEFPWTVPCDLDPGDGYYVKIYAVSDFSVLDFGDADFTVVEPSCVISPNGGEEWLAGSRQDLAWDPVCYGAPEDRVRLELFRGCGLLTVIAKNTANDGQFLWALPCEISEGEDFRVKISAVSDPSIMDYSDGDFAVVQRDCLVFPNGGEAWIPGATETILWDPSCFSFYVKLKLWRGSQFCCWITGSALNDGAYTWDVPCDLPAGTDYRVQIYSTVNSSNVDYSDACFSVDSPQCLVSPNGGEEWTHGTLQGITWDPACFGTTSDFVKLKLFRACQFYAWIDPFTQNDGIHTVFIPGALPVGTDYRVKVYSATDASNLDFSDADFAVTEAD